jgi:hypothetical protein
MIILREVVLKSQSCAHSIVGGEKSAFFISPLIHKITKSEIPKSNSD